MDPRPSPERPHSATGKGPGRIGLVCLDMAGTTVRDGGAVIEAFDAALADAGLQEGSQDYENAAEYARLTMGQSKIAVFRDIFGGDEELALQANKSFETAYAESIHSPGGAVPIPGAEETVEACRAEGIPVALTTGFSAATRDQLIAALGWDGLCDLVLSPEDAGRGRPYPDMLLTALIRLGIDDVAQIAAVGDTTSDLLAGSRAGASIIAGVRTGAHGDEQFATVPHTHVIDSVADLPKLIAAYNSRPAVA
ncbi:phosphonatase-like hydrolase [Saxibacter everestensis]|uniref:Phosphonatase-like hydrolase n=1 Tax=Saxibacter everestensis TaxID=2909229 RepID=A0ABY8QY53_9MICO|nr:phosphonatase-like hydrolase [Brevibacteriaceae bacterium ZFBP1038]